MGTNLNLSWLEVSLAKGENFEVTDEQYRERTGRQLPQTASYIRSKRSPIGSMAAKNGFTIQVVEVPIIQKRLIFTKK
jgi:hypothetical protein